MSVAPTRLDDARLPDRGFPARHLLERNLRVYKRIWPAVVSGAFEPAFYLFAVGVGLGALVGDVTGPGGEPVSYAVFVAPALLAASAMNGAITESTFNLFSKLKQEKTYDAILATPMRPSDIAIGEITFSQLRGALYGVGFLVIALVAGLVPSVAGAVLAVPAAILIGFAFGAVGMACTTWMRSWQDFDKIQLTTLPLFLFSATFYPLDVYPGWLQAVARLSPLYHGVEVLRACWFWVFDVTVVGHVAVLVAMTAGGLVVAGRRLAILLLR
jgi:lipooligosaccharide transport system permease protein